MVDAPAARDERTILHDYLTSERRHLLANLEGLDEAALRRSIVPSGWTPLGLVQHLTLDVERFWFAGVMAGNRAVLDELFAGGNAWEVGDDVSAEAVIAAYEAECARSDAVIANLELSASPGYWPEGHFGDWQPDSLRWLVVHVIAETAGHAGHLDIVRELIDGHQYLVLT